MLSDIILTNYLDNYVAVNEQFTVYDFIQKIHVNYSYAQIIRRFLNNCVALNILRVKRERYNLKVYEKINQSI